MSVKYVVTELKVIYINKKIKVKKKLYYVTFKFEICANDFFKIHILSPEMA